MVSNGNISSIAKIQGENPPTEGPKSLHSSNASKLGLLKFRLLLPTEKFRQIAQERDALSRSVSSSTMQGFEEHYSGTIASKFQWKTLLKSCKEYLNNPLKLTLLLWVVCVAVSGAILFLVMTGMLNRVLPNKAQRDAWFEVNNQILNALFTLMCLYQHPRRFHHIVLLCRWKPKDISVLREIYCKNGTYKPQEWVHMMVVVLLLHLNCFAQYALCGLNLGYDRSNRPIAGVAICLSVAIAAPAIAAVYSILSPLGKEYDSGTDEESRKKSTERRLSFASRDTYGTVVYVPEWQGRLFDFWDDVTVAYLSIGCSFCLFGWNMERLGLGNMYVHVATFLLFLMAPFWIFSMATINLDSETIREGLGFCGIVLSLFGLCYGGFWRIQMRKKFGLPGDKSCCGKPAIMDCAKWLFCCWCSLAQEVRTADFYDVVEDKFCTKPLAHEDSKITSANSSDKSKRPSDNFRPGKHLPKVEEQCILRDATNIMKPPRRLSMELKDSIEDKV